jgi:hypothetical protein
MPFSAQLSRAAVLLSIRSAVLFRLFRSVGEQGCGDIAGADEAPRAAAVGRSEKF